MDVIPQSSENLSEAERHDRREFAMLIDHTGQSATVPDRCRDSATIRVVDLDLKHALEQFPSEATLETQIPVIRRLVEDTSGVSIASDFQPEEFLPEDKLLIIVPAGPPVKHGPDRTDERRRATAPVGRVPAVFGRPGSRGNSRERVRPIVWTSVRLARRSVSAARPGIVAAGQGIRSAVRQLAIHVAGIRHRADRVFDASLERVRSARASALVQKTSAAGWLRSRLREQTVRTTRILRGTRRRWSARVVAPLTVATRSLLTPAFIVASIISVVVVTRWNATEAESVQPSPPAVASELPRIEIAKVARSEAPPNATVPRDDPVRAVAPAIAPAPTPPSRPVDAAVIQRVLNRYRDAYSILSVSAVRAVWPSVDAIALRRTFSGLAEQNLEYNSCKIVADDAGAVAVCQGEAQFTRVGARTTITERREWRFRLHRGDTGWLIAAVTAR